MTALSTLLESELRDRFQRGRSLILWLDTDGVYTPFVDELARRGGFPGEVVSFGGSFLETLFALENRGNGNEPERLVVHLPGHNDASIRQTPLLELYHAGSRYEKNFQTLVREAASGTVEPGEIERFLQEEINGGEPPFPAAERWLAGHAARHQGGLGGWLEELEDGWIIDGLFDPEPHTHEGRLLRPRLEDGGPEALEVFSAFLERRVGLSRDFVRFYHGGDGTPDLDDLAEIFAGWVMSVEYADDLRCTPRLPALKPLSELQAPLVKRCRHLTRHLRDHLPDRYAELAAFVESRLEAELDQVAAGDLGQIDTFRKEADRMLEAAVEALRNRRYGDTLEWARLRPENSFWLRRNLGRRNAWAFAKSAATLGQTLLDHARPLAGVTSLDEAVERYRRGAFEVDRAHRRFEQLRLRLLGHKLPHFTDLRDLTEELRRAYRAWADALAGAFADLCERHGFLPSPPLQQRTFYDDVVQPRLRAIEQHGPVVLFLVDGLRYEMATELLAELEEYGAEVRLEGRLAELPSITPVGMNVLAPLARNGRLSPRLDPPGRNVRGFTTGEFAISDPASRVRAMQQRSFGSAGGAVLLDLATVCQASPKKLARSCAGARLVVVHSREIDESGEVDVGLATFESWLQQLSNAWHRLKALDFRTFIFTADHGFLIQDTTTADPQAYGSSKRRPKPRYVITDRAETLKGCLHAAFSSLNYDLGSRPRERYLLFRRDTKTFDTGRSATSYVHGGNSLQERMIPVLLVDHRPRRRLRLERYRIEVRSPVRRDGIYRLPVVVRAEEQAQSVLEIARDDELPIALGVLASEDVDHVVHDVEGGRRRHGHWWVPVGREVVICFDLRGRRGDQRVKIELFNPEGDERVERARPEIFFEAVADRAAARRERSQRSDETQQPTSESASPPRPVDAAPDWGSSFDDRTARVFRHVEKHGAITEVELEKMLGSARQARRFAARFDTYLDLIPFTVRTEVVAGVKRYVREP